MVMPRGAAIALFAAVSLAIPAAGWCAEWPGLERGRALYENHFEKKLCAVKRTYPGVAGKVTGSRCPGAAANLKFMI